MFQNMLLLKQIEYFAHCRTGKGISSISGSMVSRNQGGVGSLFVKHKSSHWYAAAQRLGASHHIRLYSIGLTGEHTSRPSHSALDFIQNQQHIFLIAKFPHSLQKFFSGGINSPFSLYGLHDNGAGLFIDLSFHTFQIIKVCKADTADQRLKRLLIMGISRYGQSSQTSSMEGMVHGNDLMVGASDTHISGQL